MSLATWFRDTFFWPDTSDAYAGSIAAAAAQKLSFIESNKRPRLSAVVAAPSRDEFAAWRDEPTTAFVMAALARNAEECREAWLAESWGRGVADQRKLDALRERSDALLGFTADYEAFCETLGVQPEAEASDEAA